MRIHLTKSTKKSHRQLGPCTIKFFPFLSGKPTVLRDCLMSPDLQEA